MMSCNSCLICCACDFEKLLSVKVLVTSFTRPVARECSSIPSEGLLFFVWKSHKLLKNLVSTKIVQYLV